MFSSLETTSTLSSTSSSKASGILAEEGTERVCDPVLVGGNERTASYAHIHFLIMFVIACMRSARAQARPTPSVDRGLNTNSHL